jgi:tight adherence protein C
VLVLVAAGGMSLAFALITYTLLARAQERVVVRASLRALEGYEATVDNMRDQEMLGSFQDRVVAPVSAWLTGLGNRFLPAGYAEQSRKKLVLAGNTSATAYDTFLAIRVLTLFLLPLSFFFTKAMFPAGGKMFMGVFGMLALVLLLGPDAIVNRRVAERQHAIQVKLPDMLDLLTISVEAGLGFEQALDRTIASVPGPLADEFIRMLGEVRAGASRSDAMRALDERIDVPEVRSFVLAVLQADTFGISIGRMLRAQADEMRIKRRQLAQERAQKAPVKMLVPMVFCIFPALFVVVIGPAIINLKKNF